MAVNTFGRSRTEIGSLLMRLAGYRALMLLGLIFVSHTAAAAEADMMPIISAFRHWDHHWYIWLPGDPKYEAVEVMSNDLDAAMPSLVWVFFTERGAPKRQVHYFNDARVATARGGNYREIAFAMTGAEGEPRGIMVSLNDVDGRAVAIEVEFGPEVQLTTRGAGLTDQSGHSADRHLLLFFREKNAITSNRTVTRDGIDVARPQPGESHTIPWPAAYSRNIFVAVFPFEERSVVFGTSGPIEPDVVRIAPADPNGVAVSDLIDRSKLELVATSSGQLQRYRHCDGSHVLEIDFKPPLLSRDQRAKAVASVFQISIDGFHDLMTGSVKVTGDGKAVVIDWHFERPEWARATPLQTNISYEGGGRARIALRQAPGR
jgi:hypothetical protein